MKTILIIFRTSALIVFVLLLLIHFVLKDHFRFFQVYFYAFPLPILVFMGFFITFLFYQPRSYFIFFICFSIGLTGIWLYKSYIFPRSVEIPETAKSVMFWNTANRATIPLEIISKTIRTIQPDIIGLVEAENTSESDIKQLSEDFPKYEFRILKADMFIGVKGQIDNISFESEPHSYDINFIEITLDSEPIVVALTDTFQDPTMDKRETLTTVLELANLNTTDLLIGDFNTPYESIHFRTFEKQYHSFHDYGQGFSATWLFGIPLLEIDLFFLDKSHQPLLLEKYNYPVSDHAMLVGYFKL